MITIFTKERNSTIITYLKGEYGVRFIIFRKFWPYFFLTKMVSLNSSHIGRCTICVLILGFSHPKTVKKTKNPVADNKNCKIFSRLVQEPTTLNSNQDTWFTTKPNPLSLTQSENYSFGASFDKILSNINEI